MRRRRSQQHLPRNQEHAIVTTAGVGPRERQASKRPFDCLAVVAHFHDEQPAGIRAPDISSLSPQERADRLYNRVMVLASQGKTDSVQFFAPMALTAYQMLSPMNADQRYDMGRIGEVAGAIPLAKAQADSILRENPNHLLGLILEARLATLAGDTVQLRSYERRLIAAEKAETAKKREEYVRHQDDIANALRQARKSLGIKS